MRCIFPRTLVVVFSLLSLPAISQETSVVRIGVSLPRMAAKTVSGSQSQNQLVKILNEHKAEKNVHLVVEAVALDQESGPSALTEAKARKCDYLLAAHVFDPQTGSTLINNGAAGMDYVPVFSAVVEVRLIRVADGSPFSINSTRKEDRGLVDEAVKDALSDLAREAIEQIAKGGNVAHVELGTRLNAAQKTSEPPAFAARPCSWLADSIPHIEALRGVCEYTLSLQTKMPNFICDQEVSRFRGKNKVPFDLIMAAVRYEDGKESYEQVKRNGKPVPQELAQSPGLWSTGEFGSNLRSIFDTWNQPVFEFSKVDKLGDHPAWVFTYRIARQNDPLWRLHGDSTVLAPPYKGELWIDQNTGGLLRFNSVATDIPASFAMAAAGLEIDYSDVSFPDGSSFVLPADFTVNTTYRKQDPTRNLVRFRNCHKFRAKAQIVLNVPSGSASEDASSESNSGDASVRETDAGEQIYAILREQSIRDDQLALDVERRQELNASTMASMNHIAELAQRYRALEEEKATSSTSEPPSSPSSANIETTLKVSVKFVPVTVVLRDGKGNAVGDLQREDFLLFDNGKPQPIKSFSIEYKRASGPQKQSPSLSNSAIASDTSSSAVADRSVAYVFDDIHSAFEDIASAREAAARHLAALGPQDRAAIFTTSGQTGLDFTADPKRLLDTLKALRPHPMTHGPTCPSLSQYMADLIVNQDDREALGLATRDAINCAFGGDASMSVRAEQIAKSTAIELLSAGGAENQSTLGMLRDVFRRTGSASGSRSIVLISPGFLMSTPETRQALMELTDSALRSQIVVNTLDVRGLYTPVAAPNEAHPANPVVRFRYDREEAAEQGEVMANLAYSTGGTFFHNNNDMDEGFRRTADAPEYIYVLGFSPTKLDGKFHKLKIKLNNSAKLTVQAREGYYALKPAANP